jgi:hypothetical protein
MVEASPLSQEDLDSLQQLIEDKKQALARRGAAGRSSKSDRPQE